MRVQFDLRPAGMVEKERKKKGFNLTRIIAVLLMLAFLASSGGYIATMTLQSFRLRDEIVTRQSMVSSLQMERVALERQVNELRARERVFADALRVMNEDLPTIEVLHALEANMDLFGIGFNSLRFVTGAAGNVVEVTGLVASDRQIIDFSDRLSATGIFRDVFLPITQLNEATGMISFTLRMPVRPIGEISALLR